MALQTLLVQNLRIIQNIELLLAADANLFVGENGAGKTSILEAIDILSRGRSFRERRTKPLLRKDATDLVIHCTLENRSGPIRLGIQKTATQTRLHCNQEKVASISNHASYLPVVSMHPDSHELIQGSAKNRRNYLDWSVFHVKPGYLQIWRDYTQCLKQRNQMLRDQIKPQTLSVWTQQLSGFAEKVDHARSEIFDQIKPYFEEYSRRLLPESEININYYRGWPEGQSLTSALEEVQAKESQIKITRLGAHRADLKLRFDSQAAAATASRGQQKLLVASMILAQIEHFQQTTHQNCVVLLDDIRAELDQTHAKALLSALQNLGCQVFITAIEPEHINLQDWQHKRVFHVEQGNCKPMN